MRRLRVCALTVLGASLVAGAVAIACGPTGFPDSSIIGSVRILASRTDHSYAHPGTTVHSEVLAVDGRPDATTNEPMRIFWLPFICINPPNDAFYACFAQFEQNASSIQQYGGAGLGGQAGTSAVISGAISAWDGGPEAGLGPTLGLFGGGDGGAPQQDGGLLAKIPAGTDISRFLVQGTRVAFNLPSDIVQTHAAVKGGTQYGLAVAFNIACAGHVELIPLDPTNVNPEQIPFGCFNAQEQQLSADNYVIGYSEVFAYTSLSNTNPTISSLTFQGKPVALEGGVGAPISVAHCNSANKPACPDAAVVVGVPDASWLPDPQDPGPDGGPLGEQIWVDYFTSIGSLGDDAILIFDPTEGRVKPPHNEQLQTDAGPANGTLWAVVHDNRGGASWITVPVHSQ